MSTSPLACTPSPQWRGRKNTSGITNCSNRNNSFSYKTFEAIDIGLLVSNIHKIVLQCGQSSGRKHQDDMMNHERSLVKIRIRYA